MNFFGILLTVLTVVAVVGVNCGELEWGDATEITDNGIFSLQNQHDGKFLTGLTKRAEWKNGLDQKFTFTKNDNSWKIVALDQNQSPSDYIWSISDVGHGKYQLKSLTTALCLQVQGIIGEVGQGPCDKDDPKQRWFAAIAP